MKQHQAILAAMPGTQRQIAQRTGMSPSTVWRHMSTLLMMQKTHVSGLQPAQARGKPQPVYAVGESPAPQLGFHRFTESGIVKTEIKLHPLIAVWHPQIQPASRGQHEPV